MIAATHMLLSADLSLVISRSMYYDRYPDNL